MVEEIRPIRTGLERVSVWTEQAPDSGASALYSELRSRLRGRPCGLVTNHTGLTPCGATSFAILSHFGADVRALFSPEHGPRGKQEGDVASSSQNGLVCHSLYGESRRPTSDMLRGLETVVFDIQDVGARFYTYCTTLCYLLEACSAQNIAVVVLDRPNPLGGVSVEGPLVDEGQRSFVGYPRVPVRHGLTLGELALWHCADSSLDVKQLVVPVENWRREMLWPQCGLVWPTPSPNLPNFAAAEWYPGTCLAEFSGVSVGRGTAAPFAIVGAPWLDAQLLIDDTCGWPEAARTGLEFETVEFTPSRATHEGSLCRGIRFRKAGEQPMLPVALGLALLASLRRTHPQHFTVDSLRAALPLLGSEEVLAQLERGDLAGAIGKSNEDAKQFDGLRGPSLLYK